MPNIKQRFVLDTNAVIFITTKGSYISAKLEKDLNESELFISGITEIELFSKQGLPDNEEHNLRNFISDRFSIINLPAEVKKETIALRRVSKLKLPDCIIAATAIMLDAVLLTDDAELLRLNWTGYKALGISMYE